MDDNFQSFSDPAKRYIFEKLLGEGGMGIVNQMHDRALGRSVAMKQLKKTRAEDEDALVFLVTEARIAGMLEHPNIIPVYDTGTLNGQTFYTMRLMDSMSLQDALHLLRIRNPEAERKYPMVHLMRIFLRVCMGVDYAHSRGVIHRDLKPENVRLGHFSEVQVADWGLARVDGMRDLAVERATNDALARGETDPCIVIGSPNYMSPEQACGLNQELDFRSDIYSLGAMLYEILTLAAPHEDPDTMVLLDKVELEPVIPPSKYASNRMIPSSLEALCMECLDKSPENRPQDVRVIARKIQDYLDGHQRARAANAQAFSEIERGHRFSNAYLRLRHAKEGNEAAAVDSSSEAAGAVGEARLSSMDFEISVAWAEAQNAFVRALAFDPDDLVARAKLSELAFNRLIDMETENNDLQCQIYWNMLLRYNDGTYDKCILGHARVDIMTTPPGATVHVKSFVDVEAVSDPGYGKAVGRAPVKHSALSAGLYQVTVELPGYVTTSKPLFLHAGASRFLTFELKPVG